jgi:polyhydroxyalkanoate synthesis regulator phasin
MYCGFSTRVAPAFDTHDLVKRLMASGFTSEQAEVVLQSMKQAAEQYAHTADSIYPTKIEMIEKNLAYKADFAAMKSDLVLMLKQDVALLKNEIHKVWQCMRFTEFVVDGRASEFLPPPLSARNSHWQGDHRLPNQAGAARKQVHQVSAVPRKCTTRSCLRP